VQRIAATSRGLSENSSATLWDFGGAAIVEWEQHLVSRLFLVVGVRAGLKLHDDAFTVHIDGTDTKILTMSALRFSASLGLGWQLL
jgi:hypothetical protein